MMDRHTSRAFSKSVKQNLSKSGKSQRDLATALNVSPAYVSQIISGKKSPPDLSRQKNHELLRVWSEFLNVEEQELIDLVMHDLHGTPLPPSPRHPRFRSLALSRLDIRNEPLKNVIRALVTHPAEQSLINILSQVYLIDEPGSSQSRALVFSEMMESFSTLIHDADFIDTDLCNRFDNTDFSWFWDEVSGRIHFYTESRQLNAALELIEEYHAGDSALKYSPTVPLVGHVSATEGFDLHDGDFLNNFSGEHTPTPIGVDPGLYPLLYCVRVRGDSLRHYFGDGAILYVKSGSWQEVLDGDLVVFRDNRLKKAFIRKIEFYDDCLLVKPMSSSCRDMVIKKTELPNFERVVSVVF